MVFRIGMAVILMSVLAACSTTPDDGSGRTVGQNPFEYCSTLGIEDGSEEYNNCVSEYIHKYCTEQQGAEPGTETYRECASSLREATFLRDQMQIRGY